MTKPRSTANGPPVNFCVNGTYGNRTAYAGCSGSNTTLPNGIMSFSWYTGDVGAFSVHAFFGGTADYLSCDGYALVNVSTLPLSVLFSVSPAEFVPGDQVTLNATIIDPSTGSPSSHTVGVNFFDFPSGGSNPCLLGSSYANSYNGGIALYTVPNYPTDGKAHAYSAVIVNCTDQGVTSTVSNVVSSPVQLTVGSNTTLSLTVSNTSSPSQYRVGGWLMSGYTGLGGSNVRVKVNDTDLGSLVTLDHPGCCGYFSFVRDFPAVNNSPTTYTVTVSFNGEDSLSASATSTAPDGTSYAACTTTQFNLKPSSNMTVLTVTPKSTQALQATKSRRNTERRTRQRVAEHLKRV
jgi:hypothetical protein